MGYLILAVWVVGAIVGPGWLFVWELRKGRTLPPFRVERATQSGRYWLCMAAHVVFWVLWILLCVLLYLVYAMMQPAFYN